MLDQVSLSPSDEINSAYGWLYRAQDSRSMMRDHALSQAADALDRAAQRASYPQSRDCAAAASMCRSALRPDDDGAADYDTALYEVGKVAGYYCGTAL